MIALNNGANEMTSWSDACRLVDSSMNTCTRTSSAANCTAQYAEESTNGRSIAQKWYAFGRRRCSRFLDTARARWELG